MKKLLSAYGTTLLLGLAALPVGVLAGLGVGFAVRLLKPLKAGWRAAAGAVLAAVVCLPMGAGAVRYAQTALPSAADSMAAAMDYIRYIERTVDCPIRYVSVGADRDACIQLK